MCLPLLSMMLGHRSNMTHPEFFEGGSTHLKWFEMGDCQGLTALDRGHRSPRQGRCAPYTLTFRIFKTKIRDDPWLVMASYLTGVSVNVAIY